MDPRLGERPRSSPVTDSERHWLTQCLAGDTNAFQHLLRPHLAGLWYLPVDGRLDCWTYAASQKARNLQRDPRATLLTEAGSGYQELRGVSMECTAELVPDPTLPAPEGLF